MPIRLAYIHSTKTHADLAVEFGVTRAAVMKRASIEKWSDLRQQASETISTAATARYEKERSDALATWNAQDLKLAGALRQQLASAVQAAKNEGASLTPTQLRSLAGAHESIQRAARLALGASTDNHGVAGPGGEGPVLMAGVSLEQYEEALSRLLATI